MANQTGVAAGETGTVFAVRSAITMGSFEEFIQLAYLSYYRAPGGPRWIGVLGGAAAKR